MIVKLPCSLQHEIYVLVLLHLLAEMATFTSDRRAEKSGSIGSSCIFLLLVANCQFVGRFKIVDYLQWHSIDDKYITILRQLCCLLAVNRKIDGLLESFYFKLTLTV